MKRPARNDKLMITEGMTIGRLTVYGLVRNIQEHPLYVETPLSYLRQGRLRECVCDCGFIKLICESALSTGRIMSCGCLKAEIRAKSALEAVTRLEKKALRSQINNAIKIEQVRLKSLQMVNVHYRDEKAIDACGTRLRSLFAQKAIANRKPGNSPKEVWQRALFGGKQEIFEQQLSRMPK